VKVNRKSTPQMVKHKTFASDFQRLEREQHNRERFSYTIALLAFLVVAVLVLKLVVR